MGITIIVITSYLRVNVVDDDKVSGGDACVRVRVCLSAYLRVCLSSVCMCLCLCMCVGANLHM